MTEKEAKTKWCPFARAIVADANEASGNRWVGNPFGQADLCIASACMAWRTRHMDQAQRGAMFRDERRLHPEMTADQLWSRVNSYDHPDGYCGLAGAPQ